MWKTGCGKSNWATYGKRGCDEGEVVLERKRCRFDFRGLVRRNLGFAG